MRNSSSSSERHPLEHLAGALGLPRRPDLVADLRVDLGHLLVEDLAHELGGDGAAVLELAPWRIHCQICEREISAVAASSISELIAAAPRPPSQKEMY